MIRNQRTDALDTILESLGKQVVPPDFHSGSSASSLFGSQHGSEGEGEDSTPFSEPSPSQSPTETLRNVLTNGLSKKRKTRNTDRSRWKNLRDFVDERAVEEVLDTIESDRNSLDVSTCLFVVLGCYNQRRIFSRGLQITLSRSTIQYLLFKVPSRPTSPLLRSTTSLLHRRRRLKRWPVI